MTRLRPLLAAIVFLSVALPTAVPAYAATPTFGQPTVDAALGSPITMTSTIVGDDVASVDVVMHLAGNPTTIVVAAHQTEPAGTWQAQADFDVGLSATCSCHATGSSAPNTRFDFQFRVHAANGTTTLGPVAQGTVEDTRFNWQTLADGMVVVHWYSGSQAFAQSAADIANAAIDKASQLIGATLDNPADVFIYDTEENLRSAVSPNRENIAGQAHPAINTLFVWIAPGATADQELVSHELTHLVFHRAVDNPFNGVPTWLDEGTAVYLSTGYTPYWRGFVDPAVAGRTVIPLQGLRGLFPSVTDEFYLAYAEAVAAVDFFVRTYGEQKFWDLVRSYSTGISDDEAFMQATGADLAAFNAAWFDSLGLQPPDPVGPQPGAPGPLPPDWSGDGAPATAPPGPTLAPGQTLAPGATNAPSVVPRPTPAGPGSSAGQRTDLGGTLVILGLVVVLILGTLLVGLALRNRRPGPPML